MEKYLSVIQQGLEAPLVGFNWIFQGEPWLLCFKISFLLLPAILLIGGFWLSAFSLPTLVFRRDRMQYIVKLLISWWDSGRAILNFWLSIVQFFLEFFSWALASVRLLLLGGYQGIKELIFTPATMIIDISKSYAKPGIPWVAVTITFIWILLEAITFTFILTPLVSQILYGMTNVELSMTLISSGLFVFLFFLVGGSLACMHGLVEAFDRGQKSTVVKMLIIEFVVMSVEVVFFYREFVEAILPFFSRMTENGLSLHPFAILGIGAFAWIGVRSSIWFFFGKYGTPTILMLISRNELHGSYSGVKGKAVQSKSTLRVIELSKQLKKELLWFSARGKAICDGLLLATVQVLAVLTNFTMLVSTGSILFNLPLKNFKEVSGTSDLIDQVLRNLKEV